VTGVVRTVLGDVPAERLGATYLHEHLIIDSPLVHDRFPHIWLPSAEDATAEVRTCAVAGAGAMLDAMPCASGRDVGKLAAVSRATGVHVVAATGLHTAKYYDGRPWTQQAEPEVLAELFTADVVEGIDAYDYSGPVVHRTAHRAGVVKVATAGETPGAAERRAFAAAAETVRRTGVPLLTHCEEGRGAPAQVELLRALEVPLGRVVLSHTDKVRDLGYHRDLLQSGVNVEYDQALRQEPDEPRGTAWLLTEALAAGHGAQVLLGTDGARRSLWRSLGGSPGLDWLLTGFAPVLDRWGVDAAARSRLLVDNPARVLALAPGPP
jgi:predicted metal-dependent phosphotriesterase family hydrolase